ncbi:hypothetical protein [Haloactinomyces albus]|uniref:Uncharacterized protein n=1 Tax=Haloactinomyces albus TaxID=1352928 RepID=A0AAE3ZE76_9ACTN|nr:hypothetical protein [Haloactinomyces albus]MDR7302265.1 hypothetical protein [Haloactinomyces albus]
MRTHFEPHETDEFEAAKELLVRRCQAWAEQQQLIADPFSLATALDYRHDHVDGRLGFWTAELVREFLLTWMPRKVTATAEDVADAPETLRTLLRYLHHTELADPTGDFLVATEAAIDAIGTEFRQTMSDKRNFGLAKFWMMTAIDAGVDVEDDAAMQEFIEGTRQGAVDYDSDVLDQVVTRHLQGDDATWERAPLTPPVTLPPESELADAAENTVLIRQLRALVEWLGDGRSLTRTGQLKLADARELVTELETGDVLDPVIAGRTFRTKSSAELTGLNLIVTWAKKARLVRVVKNRLVPIAKAEPLLRDGLALWNRAVDVAVDLHDEILPPPWRGHESILHTFFREIVPDFLRTLYGMPERMPVIRLHESLWSGFRQALEDSEVEHSEQEFLRQSTERDVWRILQVLADIGAVELTTGVADPLFLTDLDENAAAKVAVVAGDAETFPEEARERLRTSLAPENGPIDLARLTPLGAQRVRTWMLAQGRCAPRVGELAGATPAQLLATVAEQYGPETGRQEIEHWLSLRGDTGPEQLIDAVRDCPFRSRAAAMLDVLVDARPDGTALLHRLRSDESIGPLATSALMTDGQLEQEDLTEREQLLGLTEQLTHTLEVAGPDSLRETLLAEATPTDAAGMLSAAVDSGHPAILGLTELRALAAEPMQQHARSASVHPLAGVARNGRPGAKSQHKRKR